MHIAEKSVQFRNEWKSGEIFSELAVKVDSSIGVSEHPIRFAVTASNSGAIRCEIGVIKDASNRRLSPTPLFEYRQRKFERTENFNVVLIIPTGVGAEIGGHAGDATAVSRMMAEIADTLVLHPNVVNASDINEMAEGCLYVEGSILSRLLQGTVGLQRVRNNRVLVVLDNHPDEHFLDAAVNSVSAARATYGLDCPAVLRLPQQLWMRANYSETGRAVGMIGGVSDLLDEIDSYDRAFDAIAISSVIRVPQEYHLEYFTNMGQMVNPWGGVEAMLTHSLSSILNVQTAHSPMFESREIENLEVGVVDPRMSAEAVSLTFLQCILKGLHKSPKVIADKRHLGDPGIFSAEDVSCVVVPSGCLGLPVLAALEQGIKVIEVTGNKNIMSNDLSRLPWIPGQFLQVDNYMEAIGAMAAIRAGVTTESVKRPITTTLVRGVSATRRNDMEKAS